MGQIRLGARVLVGLVVLLQVIGVVVPHLRPALTTLCLLTLHLTGAVFALRASRGGDRIAWRLVAAGELLTTAANAGLGTAHATGRPALFWVGSACGIAMYVSFALAAFAFPAQRLRGWQLAALAGETLAVLGCGFMYVWFLVLQPLLSRDTDWSRWPLLVGFPLGDLLMLTGVAAVVLRGGLHARTLPVAMLVAGLVAFLLGDAAFNAVGYDGNHAAGPLPATLSMLVASACVTLAAMWQCAVAGPADDSGPQRPWTATWFSYLPYGAVGLSLALMVFVTVRDGQIRTWGGLVLGLTVVTGGVAIRQVVSVRDSRQHETMDPLTGLSNRVGLARQATRALRRAEPVALLLIDLDGFKAVNDTHGHGVGDLLLLEFAATLRRDIRAGDVACRIGGDEFVVLQRDVTGEADVVALARRVLATAAKSPIHVDGRAITARASIGAALAADGDTADDLRHRADIAMYQAKRAGTHDVVVYQPGMLDRRADDAALGEDLEEAVSSGQLRVLYQPMVDLSSGRPVGAEALVRWHHPLRGIVSPLDFIPIAERTGAITGVGLYVLEQACRMVQTWAGHPYVSVNLSARQLQDPTLVGSVRTVLDRTALPPDRLVLEITESAIVDDRVALPALEALRAHGIRIAIDDFGTGYSSLQYLSRLPVDILKIDRSFVAELDNTGRGSAITEAVISLARILDMTTVAEGIETPAQAAELQRLGCRTGQGYLYAKPLAADDAEQYFTHPQRVLLPPPMTSPSSKAR
ncbi:diguanylate cyclase (GGDEF)-like protein [Actinoplanes tereljensis]|uniref:Bifunctional diguanylate cyclase/phosphodiesterase n=1 Tax=Paractinoplanes tereljensis TaxID=571912 RepID=A0A919NRT5_9ACTN|nr:bifunctional diguanylate cyclase/phosphodiesterase [Actinoplanes tereljensis]GIF22422.1 bifunctional diguanylate cyclase/phosphodiesterase [Actinoplanes tereljensis]